MVGSAVDKGMAQLKVHEMEWNSTVTGPNGTVEHFMDNNFDEVLQTRLKLAMAVTMAVGIIQVNVTNFLTFSEQS